jgi:hypothetical protein
MCRSTGWLSVTRSCRKLYCGLTADWPAPRNGPANVPRLAVGASECQSNLMTEIVSVLRIDVSLPSVVRPLDPQCRFWCPSASVGVLFSHFGTGIRTTADSPGYRRTDLRCYPGCYPTPSSLGEEVVVLHSYLVK